MRAAPSRLLTTKQAEAEYGPALSRRRQKHLRETRQLPFGKAKDGKITYRRADIEAWINANTIHAFPGWDGKGVAA